MAYRPKINLVFDTKTQKILFAEVSGDFMDLLLSLLSYPVATITELLNKGSDTAIEGCIGNLHRSIENLETHYFHPKFQNKDFLKPKAPLEVPRLLSSIVERANWKLYTCPSYHRNASDNPLAVCPHCKKYMNVEIEYVAPKDEEEEEEEEGKAEIDDDGMYELGFFMAGCGSYLVCDDLTVLYRNVSNIMDLFHKYDARYRKEDIQYKMIDISVTEALKLMQASLKCQTVLNSVFLHRIVGA